MLRGKRGRELAEAIVLMVAFYVASWTVEDLLAHRRPRPDPDPPARARPTPNCGPNCGPECAEEWRRLHTESAA